MTIEGVDIDSVIQVIEERKLIVWKETWDTDSSLIGFFIYSPVGVAGSRAINIILEFEKRLLECKVVVICPGVEEGPIGDLLRRAEESIKTDIVRLARRKGLNWKEGRVEGTFIQCPRCLFMHSAFGLIINESEIVECRNCGHEFTLDDATSMAENDYSRIECPMCRSVEDYKDYQVSWDRKVSCLNCGKTIVIDEARRYPV